MGSLYNCCGNNKYISRHDVEFMYSGTKVGEHEARSDRHRVKRSPSRTMAYEMQDYISIITNTKKSTSKQGCHEQKQGSVREALS